MGMDHLQDVVDGDSYEMWRYGGLCSLKHLNTFFVLQVLNDANKTS